jgi:hypothetical protein
MNKNLKRLAILGFLSIFTLAASAAMALKPPKPEGAINIRSKETRSAFHFKRNYNDYCELTKSYATGWIDKKFLDDNKKQLTAVAEVLEQDQQKTRIRIPYSHLKNIVITDEAALYSPYISNTASDLSVTALIPPVTEGKNKTPFSELKIQLEKATFTNCFGEYVFVEFQDPLHADKMFTQRFAISEIGEIDFTLPEWALPPPVKEKPAVKKDEKGKKKHEIYFGY